ncbi:MAG: DNA-binding protein WhiA [Clostridiales bacterium]|nr:MAG: DNA-binding protein WhiA [Clostridiales bacterium]
MSFSSSVKKELCSIHMRHTCCTVAELAGIIYTAGTVSFGSRGFSLSVNTENRELMLRIFSLLKRSMSIECTLAVKDNQLKKRDTYISMIEMSDDVQKVLTASALVPDGLTIRFDEERFAEITALPCCQYAFLRGAFLGSGTMTDPHKIYHLEFSVYLKELAGPILNTLNRVGIRARLSERKEKYIVYTKDVESIISFLTLTGAHSSVLELENIRIKKEIINGVNRRVNFESANIDRTVSSAVRQIASIAELKDRGYYEGLSNTLKQAAELRMMYPEASLSDLAAAGGVSRSCIAHRLSKINKIAETITEQS